MAKRHKKVKLSKIEKLARDIARWEAKHNAAKDMLVRSTVELKALYKKRQRARTTAPVAEHIGNGIVAIPTEHFDKAVEVPAEAFDPPAEPAMDDPNHPDLIVARELLAGVNGKLKRQRKRTPAPRGSVALASKDFAGDLAIAARESAEDQGVTRQLERSAEAEQSVEARAARMRKLGFRPTKKRAKAPL